MNLLFETKATKQMAMYQQELAKLRRAGLEGKEAQRLALKLAGAKYKAQSDGPGRKQLSWNFGQPDLPGQGHLKMKRRRG